MIVRQVSDRVRLESTIINGTRLLNGNRIVLLRPLLNRANRNTILNRNLSKLIRLLLHILILLIRRRSNITTISNVDSLRQMSRTILSTVRLILKRMGNIVYAIIRLLSRINRNQLNKKDLRLSLSIQILLLPVTRDGMATVNKLSQRRKLTIRIFRNLSFTIQIRGRIRRMMIMQLNSRMILLADQHTRRNTTSRVMLTFLRTGGYVLMFGDQMLRLSILILVISFLRGFMFGTYKTAIFFNMYVQFIQCSRYSFRYFFATVDNLHKATNNRANRDTRHSSNHGDFCHHLFR